MLVGSWNLRCTCIVQHMWKYLTYKYAVYMYSRNCFLRSLLRVAKTSLKQQVVCEQGSIRHAHAKSTLFFSNSKWKAFSKQSQCTCSCIHWYLTFSRFTQKVVSSLHKPTTKYCTCVLHCGPILQVHVHLNGSVRAKSGGHWSCWAGSRSPHRLFCAK